MTEVTQETATEETAIKTPATELPEELQKFNWGAFLLVWIWGLGNKAYFTLYSLTLIIIAMIPVVNLLTFPLGLGFAIYCGMKGNEWAWAADTKKDIAHFNKIQKNWMIAGIVVAVVSILFSALMGLVSLMLAGAMVNAITH